MYTHDVGPWRHSHAFDAGNPAGERGTRFVMWLTTAMMVAEIVAGGLTNSMALLADGLHMSSHAVAIGLSAFAYAAARRHANDSRFAFGTWKIEILGGFASAVFLLMIVALMVFGSIERLLDPRPIDYREAIAIAAVGLVVNIVSALVLGAAHLRSPAHETQQPDHHQRAHAHAHADAHTLHRDHRHDLNLRSAYVHVTADATTSVLAILALAGGWMYGRAWLDPTVGLFGAGVVALWARRLLVDTGKVLLDREMDHPLVDAIRAAIAARGVEGGTAIADLHLWRVGKAAYACALSLVTHDPRLSAHEVRQWLAPHPEIAHATIEIHRWEADDGAASSRAG
jgi:cation diffusion facilitator family transporter